MTRLLLIRHGHVEGIEPARFRGRSDLPLSELGRREAAAMAARVGQGWTIDAIYTSPLRRCVETGGALARTTGGEPQVLEGLNDLDYGAWTWKTHAEAREADPDLYERWLAAPETVRFPGDGESLQDLAARAADAFRLILSRHPANTVAVVTHDSTLRVQLLQALGLPLAAYWRLSPSPCGISEVETQPARVARVNETAHLAGLTA